MLLNRLSAFRIAMKVFRIKFKSASLRIAFQSKTHLVAYLNSKIVLLNTFARISYINFRVVNAVQLMVKLRDGGWVCGCVPACAFVCMFISFHLNKTNVMSEFQVSDNILQKYFCVKNLCRHVINNHSRSPQASNCDVQIN